MQFTASQFGKIAAEVAPKGRTSITTTSRVVPAADEAGRAAALEAIKASPKPAAAHAPTRYGRTPYNRKALD